MAEPGEKKEQKEQDLEGGLYVKEGKPFSADKVLPGKLMEVSEKTGMEFEYDGDKNTFTPKRLVVVPKRES